MIQIPTYVLSGFLGSGKTTLIKRLLENYSHEKKIAIVQNEYAAHNFDGQELKRTTTRDFDLLEVNNGSVFCVCLLSDFIQSFSKFIKEYKPEIVFFEASGLSDPIAIGELFNSPILQREVYLAGSICIVDASSFLKLEKLQQRIIHQAQIADKIIVNKTDLIDNYQPVIDKLDQINPFSSKYVSRYCELDLKILFTENGKSANNSNSTFQVSAEDIGRPDINSVVFRSTKAINELDYLQFLNEISSKMIRIKGYLLLGSGETLCIQYAGNQLKTEIIERTIQQTEIVAMGYHISPNEFKEAYLQYC